MPVFERRTAALLIAAIFCIAMPGVSEDEDGFARHGDVQKVPYTIPSTDTPVRIDGVLDDSAWENALELELKYETSPGDNAEPPVETFVLLAYDRSHLYVAFRCLDPDPSSIRARLSDRDHDYGDDFVGVILDTFNDERRSFFLWSNPFGVQEDAIFTWDDYDITWDAIYSSAGKITEWGYAVEFSVPFSSLRFQRSDGTQVWGFDAWRNYPRSVMHRITLAPRDRDNNCFFCQISKIEGFEGVSPGRNVEISPTVTAVRTDARSSIPNGDFEKQDSSAEVGVTARWGVTPNLTLSGAANPDFSQVEADALQLDINEPFALSYNEKRPFFTEGADFFNTPFSAVYTRSIRDPQWGLKLSGKEGGNAIGAYLLRDDLTNLIFPGSQGSSATSLAIESTAAVARFRRDVWNNSTLGVLMTDREGDDYHNRLLGFDGRLRFTAADQAYFQFLGSNTRYPGEVAGRFAQPEGDFSDTAWQADFEHVTRSYYGYVNYREIGKDFRADLGFMPQVGIKRAEIGAGYLRRGDSDDFITNLELTVNWDRTRESNDDPIEEEWESSFFIQMPMQSALNLFYGIRDRYYNSAQFYQAFQGFYYQIRPSSSLWLGLYSRYDDRIDFAHTRAGKGVEWSPEVSLNLGRNLRFNLQYEANQLAIDGDRLFLANTIDSTFIYQLNVRTFLRAVVQFVDIRRNQDLYAATVEPVTKDLFTQLLFSYKINPQTVLFLGYSDNYLATEDFSLTRTDRTFFVKIGYAWVL